MRQSGPSPPPGRSRPNCLVGGRISGTTLIVLCSLFVPGVGRASGAAWAARPCHSCATSRDHPYAACAPRPPPSRAARWAGVIEIELGRGCRVCVDRDPCNCMMRARAVQVSGVAGGEMQGMLHRGHHLGRQVVPAMPLHAVRRGSETLADRTVAEPMRQQPRPAINPPDQAHP